MCNNVIFFLSVKREGKRMKLFSADETKLPNKDIGRKTGLGNIIFAEA